MFAVWASIGAICWLAGLAGCVLPVLPGPPLSWAGLFVVWAARGFDAHTFGTTTALVLLGVTIAVTVLDVFAPAIGARRYGSSSWGVRGSIVGMLVGMVWFPPFGMVVGTFLGAMVGELAKGGSTRASLRAAWGVFMGTVFGIFLKLAVSGVIAWYGFREVFA